MHLTLGEVLKWDIMEKANVITTTFDPDILVENITIMEAPDIGKWIDANSIVLTGLYAIGDDKRKMAEFVNSLYYKNICALFIKVNRFVDTVPEAIIAAAEELHIAVVEMPASIRYIDIMYPVIASLFDSKVTKLSHYKHTMNALSNMALNTSGFQSLVSVFASIIKNLVVLYDGDMRYICGSDERCKSIVERIFVEEYQSECLDYSVYQTTFAENEATLRQVLMPVRVFGKIKAYVSIVEIEDAITEMDLIAAENAVIVFGFELVKNFAEEEAENHFRQELVKDISNHRNLDSLKDRLENINLSASSKYNTFIIEMPINPIHKTPAIVNQKLVNNHEIKAYELFLAAKKALKLKGFESHEANRIIAFIQEPSKNIVDCEKVLEELSQHVIVQMKKLFVDFPVHIGYTSNFQDITQCTELYSNAEDAIHISKLVLGDNTQCNYNKLGIYKIFCLARDRVDLERYIPRSIVELLDYEKKSGLALIATLRSYFQNNCNAQQTAKALFVHYKTLHYRLNKIETIARINIKDSNAMCELQMGLVILQMLDKFPNT